MTLSYIVPTIGRATLRQTLASIETEPGDEILLIHAAALIDRILALIGETVPVERLRYIPCPPGHDQGATERNVGMASAYGDWLTFIDDDDTYLPGARQKMAAAMLEAPDRPSLFQIEYPNGTRLWADRTLRVGNVSGQMILIPNDRARLGTWQGSDTNDWHFLQTMQWHPRSIAWQAATLVRMGHDDGGANVTHP